MQPYLQHAPLEEPRVFHYSLDWRFLLPIADPAKVHVLFEEDADFRLTLEQVGIPFSNQPSLSKLKQDDGNNVQSLIVPFGLPVHVVGATQKEQVEFCRSLQGRIHTGGCLVLGFNNAWIFRNKTSSIYHSSTPGRITSHLKQAGFKSVKVFGAMPNLNIPDYIFDLESQAIRFALHHRFRRKPVVLNALRILTGMGALTHISNFFPCYFAVATA